MLGHHGCSRERHPTNATTVRRCTFVIRTHTSYTSNGQAQVSAAMKHLLCFLHIHSAGSLLVLFCIVHRWILHDCKQRACHRQVVRRRYPGAIRNYCMYSSSAARVCWPLPVSSEDTRTASALVQATATCIQAQQVGKLRDTMLSKFTSPHLKHW